MFDDDARVISAQRLDYYSYTRKNVYCTDAETNGEQYSSIVAERSTILSKSRMHRVKSISHLRRNLLQQQWNDIYKFTYSRIAVDVSLRMYKHGFPSISRNLFFFFPNLAQLSRRSFSKAHGQSSGRNEERINSLRMIPRGPLIVVSKVLMGKR